MKCYAFDVDETLEVSSSTPGPVTLAMLIELRKEGHILGLCGNWAGVTTRVDGWHNLFSFLGQLNMQKHEFLHTIKQYVRAEEFVMVGNDHSRKEHESPDDAMFARLAGWRFICEDDFAEGKR